MRISTRLRTALSASAALGALAVGAAPVLAAEPSEAATTTVALEPLAVTATRSEKRVDEVPATVTVISSRKIEDALVTDIKDLVRFEPGVAVRTSPSRFTAAGASTGRDGNSGFNIRGLEGNRVLMLTDGVRVPDGYSFGAQAMGRGDYVDLGILKSVEILRGPASALYGSDGVAGAVSFITKDPSDDLTGSKPWAVTARGAYASADDSWAKGLSAAGRSGRWSALISYTRRDGHEQETKGTDNSPNINRTQANPQDIGSNALLAKLVYEPDARNRLRLTYDHLDRKTVSNVLSALAAPPLVSTSAIDLRAVDSARRDRISLDHLYTSGGGLVDAAHWTAYWQASKTREYSAEDRFTAADRTRIGAFDTRVVGGALELKSRFSTGGLEHRLVYGGDYSRTRQVGVRDGTVPPAGETFPTRAFPTTDATLAGAYLQDELAMLDGRLTAYPALRFDHYKLEPKTADPLFAGAPSGQSASRVSPKIGVLFKAAPAVALFVNYAAGFKAPAPNQVNNGFANLVSNYRSVSNPNLKPETSTTLEGGLRLGGGGAWTASATAFTGRYHDFISQVQVGGNFTAASPTLYQFVNLGRVRISGVEARGRAALGRGFTLDLAAAYAKGSSLNAGVRTPLDSIEPVRIVAGLGWRDPEGRFGGQINVTRSQGKSLARAGGTCGAACFTPPGFTVLDATAYWTLAKAATLRVGVFNITDQKYWWWSDVRGLTRTAVALDAYTQPGRNVGASLTVKL